MEGGFVRKVIPIAAAVALMSGAVSAQESVSAERLRELMAAAEAQTRPTNPPAPAGEVNLEIEEAVRLALDRNLDIAVERLNPQTFDLSLASLRSIYRPTLTSTFGKNNRIQLPTNTLTGGTRVQNDTLSANGGTTQSVPWGGGNYALTFNNSKTITNSANANFNPQYQTAFNFNFTQPLLRNFSIDNTRQQLVVTRINRDISEVQLRATITNTLSNTRNAYWDLVYTTEALDAARQSLALAEKLVDDNKTRVEIGTMAPIDVVQAESEAASRRQTLVAAEANFRTAQLALKRLIVNGTDDPMWRAAINPTDRPGFQPAVLDVEAAVRAALEKRTDITQAKRTLEANDVTIRYLRNQMLPQLDLVANYGLQGIGGTQFQRQDPRRADSPIIAEFPGNYFDALRVLSDRNYPLWTLQLNISYPLGQSANEANFERARVQRNQAAAEIRALELQIATEVTSTALQVQSNLERVQAATAARELAQRRLEAETSKFEVGMSTNFFVVQAQRDLADAQNVELRALLDYRKSQVDFERVQETAISRAGITVVTGGGGAR
jgi:outer membrane protein TolC